VLPFGKEIVELVKQCYKEGEQVQDATFRFVNELFGEFGLVVLIPDNPALKKLATKIFEDDLLNQSASEVVNRSIERLKSEGYKAQAQPRDINLFYLVEGSRERVVAENGSYKAGSKKLTKQELLNELKESPDRFSPNVILRGIYQELILPNIIFVGGGGELAYWLQYRDLFDHYKIPFPVLLLRNSFVVVEKKWREKIAKTGLRTEDLFKSTEELVNMIVQRESKNKVKLNGVFDQTVQFYDQLKRQTQPIDETLVKHIEALKTKTIHRLQELEKKMLRAEKRKFSDQQRQVQALKEKLFPNNGLQERVDNFLPYYAKWGKDFINKLYNNSLALEQEFVILEES
jgi:bacillithiol biosynthesis cysteine-adding enzyme BshC